MEYIYFAIYTEEDSVKIKSFKTIDDLNSAIKNGFFNIESNWRTYHPIELLSIGDLEPDHDAVEPFWTERGYYLPGEKRSVVIFKGCGLSINQQVED